MKDRYDLLILGGGPGGYVAAIRAAHLGLRVAVVEKEALGGTCLHHGCIPSKSLIRSAEVLSLIQRSETFGIKVGSISADFGLAVDRSQEVIQKLHRGLTHLMKKHRIDTYSGRGRLTAPGQIEVACASETRVIRGTHTLIATGSRIQTLPNLKVDGKRVLSSDEALLRRELPESIAIVGGGAIGVEFAYIYSVYGVKVTIVEMAPSLLPTEDHEVSALLARSFKRRGISILCGRRVKSVKDQQSRFTIEIESTDGAAEEMKAAMILVAVGRVPNVEGIGLEEVGVRQENSSRLIQVDEKMQTHAPNVYAIGDVSNRPALAHGAMAQGVFVAESISGTDRTPLALDDIPNAVYCQPQIASVGLTEAAAREKGYAVKVAKFPLSANGKAIALGETEGFIKIVSDEKEGTILGAHLIGAEATELIGEFVLAKTLEATPLELKLAIHPHPTLSEAVMEAGGAIYGEAIHW